MEPIASVLLTDLTVFFPNNDVSTLRRLRIQRAQEHGAQWAREWSSDITHVIIDKDLSYQDLVIHLKLASVPVRPVLRWSN